MSHHNPDLQPPHQPHPNEAIRPDAHDFVETPDVPPINDERTPIPIWLYLVCGAALFLAGSSFTGFSTFGMGLLDQGAGAPVVSSNKGAEAAADNDPMSIGKKIYGLKCAVCHQPTGQGQPGKYPPLPGSEWVLGSKERLAAILLHGLHGPVTVKGGSFGSDLMPAQEGDLNDSKIADVMTYIRGSWDNKASAVKAEDVAATRTKFESRKTPWTAEELLKDTPATDADEKK